ncbi:MAG TPA: trehalose-phosphatase [Burkholderiales bacterium]|nr:trehalose-phosphatase [Burkholderiales bacterium]
MQILDQGLEFDAFFEQLRGAKHALLLSDYDGTLAPFHIRPERAKPYPGVRECLDAVSAGGRTRLVVVSGRHAHELAPLLQLREPVEIWGCHGWERLLPNGSCESPQIPEAARAGLYAAAAQAAAAVAGMKSDGQHARIERKTTSVAVHWRGMAPEVAQQVRQAVATAWAPLERELWFGICDFDGGIELRLSGRTKGDAVTTALAESGPGTVAAYLGDDLTDEDAFRAIAGKGLGVLVRGERRPSVAGAWIRPPEGITDFLGRWHRTREG